MPAVIRMSRENCKCPVELLGHHQSRQRVGHRHRPQRKQQSRSPSRRVRPSVRRSHREHQVLGAFIAPPAEPLCERLRTHRSSAAIEQHCRNRCPSRRPRQPFEQRRFAAEVLRAHPRKRRTALQIHPHQRIASVFCRRAGADLRQGDLHEKENIANRRADP